VGCLPVLADVALVIGLIMAGLGLCSSKYRQIDKGNLKIDTTKEYLLNKLDTEKFEKGLLKLNSENSITK